MPTPFQFTIVKTPVVKALVVKGPTGATGPAGADGADGSFDEGTPINTLTFYDPELASGENVSVQFLNGVPEVFSPSIGSDSLVRASAMQTALSNKQDADLDLLAIAGLTGTGYLQRTGVNTWSLGAIDLSTKQDASAFLTTLAGIGGTSGTGNLARVTSPTFVTPVLGAAACTTLQIGSGGPIFDNSTTTIRARNAANSADAPFTAGATTISGNLLPSVNNTHNLGNQTGNAWNFVFCAGGLYVQGNSFVDGSRNCTAASITIGAGTAILKVLSATATLDFGSVAANSYADLTITVTGAAIGNVVSLGVPNGSMLNDISFFAWVSTTNTVTVRCSNVSSTTARDPASGTFRAQVTQF